jgi:hypothetical protein
VSLSMTRMFPHRDARSHSGNMQVTGSSHDCFMGARGPGSMRAERTSSCMSGCRKPYIALKTSSNHAAYVPNQAAARMLSRSSKHLVKEYIWHNILSKLAQSWSRHLSMTLVQQNAHRLWVNSGLSVVAERVQFHAPLDWVHQDESWPAAKTEVNVLLKRHGPSRLGGRCARHREGIDTLSTNNFRGWYLVL